MIGGLEGVGGWLLLDQQGCTYNCGQQPGDEGPPSAPGAVHRLRNELGSIWPLRQGCVIHTTVCVVCVCVCASLSRRVNNVLPVDLSSPHLSPCTATKEPQTSGVNVGKSSDFLSGRASNVLDQWMRTRRHRRYRESTITPPAKHHSRKPTEERDKERQASTWPQHAPDRRMNKLYGSWKLPLHCSYEGVHLQPWSVSSLHLSLVSV